MGALKTALTSKLVTSVHVKMDFNFLQITRPVSVSNIDIIQHDRQHDKQINWMQKIFKE